MLIVHLSDIHCGPDFEGEVFMEAVDEINELSPDLIVIAGDLTENGYLSEFKFVKEKIEMLKCRRVIVGIGNHDYRHTGYLLYSRFFPRPEVMEFRDYVVIYLSSARPDRDEGEIGYRQIMWLKSTLENYEEHFKIVTLHHHLISVPDTGIERNTVNDAGDVLRALITEKVHLVLCGHRHRPWMWNLEGLPIVHAGSVASRKLRGFFKNSYNIVTIEEGKVDVKIKVVGGAEMGIPEIMKPYIEI